jgi:anti-sigma regulatory factor (Ser/Thr protein kinase)
MAITHSQPFGTDPGPGIARIAGRYRLPSDVVAELKHVLAEDPQIVILDLALMAGDSHLAARLLEPVSGYLAAWPGTVLVVCVPDPLNSRPHLPPVLADRVLLVRSLEAGLERVRHAVPHQERITTYLTPEPQASEEGRTVARRILRAWQMENLIWPASLVVSELVTHSIEEAHTVLDLTLARVEDRMRITVHDYGADKLPIPSPTEPAAPLEDTVRHRGLLMVTALTRRWGVFPSRVHGKTVWAVMENG